MACLHTWHRDTKSTSLLLGHLDAGEERMYPGLNSISLVLSSGAREESVRTLPQPPPLPHAPGCRLHSPQVTTRKVRHQAASGWLFITPSPPAPSALPLFSLPLPRSPPPPPRSRRRRRRRRRRQVGSSSISSPPPPPSSSGGLFPVSFHSLVTASRFDAAEAAWLVGWPAAVLFRDRQGGTLLGPPLSLSPSVRAFSLESRPPLCVVVISSPERIVECREGVSEWRRMTRLLLPFRSLSVLSAVFARGRGECDVDIPTPALAWSTVLRTLYTENMPFSYANTHGT